MKTLFVLMVLGFVGFVTPAVAVDNSPVVAALPCEDCKGSGWVKCGWCGGDGIRNGKMCTFCKKGKIKCIKCMK